MNRIAIVGMACLYPDAANPQELWENALSGRRAFRRMPDVRTPLTDYYDPDPAAPDKFYADHAAVLSDYSFDRLRFTISGGTYRATDLTHWLALDVASRALADAGFVDGEGLPRDRTGVVVGNTLTGEFSRSHLMRLRWPYVRRTVEAELTDAGWTGERLEPFLDALEARYKSPFPSVGEDTLAGGLANTIAGRICNYFDLHGGGYTVDGACSSSLLSVTTAARSLVDGELDVAVAGGVDLSLDPFEIVGFAKTGALARTEMKLYDEGSNGFWPGEGCGMVVLMREEDLVPGRHRPLAWLTGWGVSSDGAGGMTRPEMAGYRLALDRAYARAGCTIDTVGYLEGHGTGTPVGDELELSALSGALQEAGARRAVAVGSVKAQIGHTKAAAGVAGLIKAVQAVRHGVVPPTIGCTRPHPRFEDSLVRPVHRAEPWPVDGPRRAGITSMGFGGINTHVVVEGPDAGPDVVAWDERPDVRTLAGSRQDAEVLLFGADSPHELAARLRTAAAAVDGCSYAELTDHAVPWAREAAGIYRAGTVATSPRSAVRRLTELAEHLERVGPPAPPAGRAVVQEVRGGGHVGVVPPGASLDVGLLFPGQGTGSHLRGGALDRHLPQVATLRADIDDAALRNPVATENAQPLTVVGSLGGLAALRHLGVRARAATGHSLGELCALAWAGALGGDDLLPLARTRGDLMATRSLPGTMATLDASATTVRGLLPDTDDIAVAALNSPRHTVVAGTTEAVDALLERAAAQGVTGRLLPVSHAFHSPLMRPAAEAFAAHLTDVPVRPLADDTCVVSTVTGDVLSFEADSVAGDVADLLGRQVVEPVRFEEALHALASRCGLLIEVGPGASLSRLAVVNALEVPTVALDTDDATLVSYLTVAAAAWVAGGLPETSPLWADRFHRGRPQRDQSFLQNPMELEQGAAEPDLETPGDHPRTGDESVLQQLVAAVAAHAELPTDAVSPDSRLLDDLHLSSITVGTIVSQVAGAVGVDDLGRLNLATSTVAELAQGIETLRTTSAPPAGGDPLGALAPFVGTWTEELVPEPSPSTTVPDTGPSAPWTVRCAEADAASPWTSSLADITSGGILLCLPPETEASHLRGAFEAVRDATGLSAGQHLVVLGGNDTTAALAKTFYLEHPEVHVTIVDGVPWVEPHDLATEVAATRGFSHVRHVNGVRHVPRLVPRHLPPAPAAPAASTPPLLLATGGSQGITAECALAWASRHQARVVLVGRSDPSSEHVTATLERFEHAGLTVHYLPADLADPAHARAAVERIVDSHGPVTHLLHGAGRNEPAALTHLRWEDVEATMGPKSEALRTILATLADLGVADELRHLVTFGSVIGRAGLWGEAHYALANAELARLTRAHAESYPRCRATCIEWSVWGQIGMGARLGVVERLEVAGISAIDPTDGVAVFLRSADAVDPPRSLTVSGRLDGIPTVSTSRADVPLRRFLDRVRRHHGGFEIVVDSLLSVGTDPYLDDHVVDGDRVLPGVIGLEAMAQAAAALTGEADGPVSFRDVEFERPVVVPASGELSLRVGATRAVDGSVAVVLLSETTGYSSVHFRARLAGDVSPAAACEPVEATTGSPAALDPRHDLYGPVLFQGGRFQRVGGYRALSSTEVWCDLTEETADWFVGPFPTDLRLGDPGARDAVMHGNQVSIPDSILVPGRIDRLDVIDSAASACVFLAREVRHDGALHVYDIDVRDQHGGLVEQWRGLHLHAVRRRPPRRWAPPLLGPHLERCLTDLGLESRVKVEVVDGRPVVTATVAGTRTTARGWLGTTDDGRTDVASVLGCLVQRDVEARLHGHHRGAADVRAEGARALVMDVTTTDDLPLRVAVAWEPEAVGGAAP